MALSEMMDSGVDVAHGGEIEVGDIHADLRTAVGEDADGFDAVGHDFHKLGAAALTDVDPVVAFTTLDVGGTGAAVTFAGVISPGLYQFNVVVPSSTPNGDNTIAASYNGYSAQTGVLLSVQH